MLTKTESKIKNVKNIFNFSFAYLCGLFIWDSVIDNYTRSGFNWQNLCRSFKEVAFGHNELMLPTWSSHGLLSQMTKQLWDDMCLTVMTAGHLCNYLPKQFIKALMEVKFNLIIVLVVILPPCGSSPKTSRLLLKTACTYC